MWHVGQPVQCIKTINIPKGYSDIYVGGTPQSGHIYIIRAVVQDCVPPHATILLLEEFTLPTCPCCGGECGFDDSLFRPLTKRNIEIVESLKAPLSEDLAPLAPLEVAFQ